MQRFSSGAIDILFGSSRPCSHHADRATTPSHLISAVLWEPKPSKAPAAPPNLPPVERTPRQDETVPSSLTEPKLARISHVQPHPCSCNCFDSESDFAMPRVMATTATMTMPMPMAMTIPTTMTTTTPITTMITVLLYSR